MSDIAAGTSESKGILARFDRLLLAATTLSHRSARRFRKQKRLTERCGEPVRGNLSIDLAQIHMFADADPLVVRELVRVFRQQAEQYITVLSLSSDQGDCRKWQETVTSLQECAEVVGAKKLAEICESAKRIKQSAEQQIKNLALLKAEYDRICAFLAHAVPSQS